MNFKILKLLSMGVSQRNTARYLHIHRKTVNRKLLFMGGLAKERLIQMNLFSKKAQEVEFDDQESCEITKMKPVTIILATEKKSRRILGLRVARMPAKGLLAEMSLKKYGPLPDERKQRRRELFYEIRDYVHEYASLASDQNPHYPDDVKEFFPKCVHIQFRGRKPRAQGQGELKKGFDPIFSINHTFAMTRYGISALIRKTWCISKKAENLSHHLHCYAYYHNLQLRK